MHVGAMTCAWPMNTTTVGRELMMEAVYRDNRPKSMAQTRQWDLNRQHAADNMHASMKRSKPQGWDMFEQDGCVVDGVWTRAWCVYARDERDHAYENGIWFSDKKVALAVLEWKRERGKRPWYVTRIAARLWGMLPWR